MEAASQMCRQVATASRRADVGAGVGGLDPDGKPPGGAGDFIDSAAGANFGDVSGDDQGVADEDDAAPIEIGIVEAPVEEATATTITRKLAQHLVDEDFPAEEIWLDVLVTALEEVGTLKQLQTFFLPMPMITPTKPVEWGNFGMKKIKM